MYKASHIKKLAMNIDTKEQRQHFPPHECFPIYSLYKLETSLTNNKTFTLPELCPSADHTISSWATQIQTCCAQPLVAKEIKHYHGIM